MSLRMAMRAGSLATAIVVTAIIAPSTGAEEVPGLPLAPMTEGTPEAEIATAIVETIGMTIAGGPQISVDAPVRATRTGDIVTVLFPGVALSPGPTSRIAFGDVAVRIDLSAAPDYDFSFSLPSTLIVDDPETSEELWANLVAGGVSGRWDANLPGFARIRVELPGFEFHATHPRGDTIDVDGSLLFLAESIDPATWNAAVKLSIGSFDAVSLVDKTVRISEFELSFEGKALDLAFWQAALIGALNRLGSGSGDVGTLALTLSAESMQIEDSEKRRTPLFASRDLDIRLDVDANMEDTSVRIAARGNEIAADVSLPAALKPTEARVVLGVERLPLIETVREAMRAGPEAVAALHDRAGTRYFVEDARLANADGALSFDLTLHMAPESAEWPASGEWNISLRGVEALLEGMLSAREEYPVISAALPIALVIHGLSGVGTGPADDEEERVRITFEPDGRVTINDTVLQATELRGLARQGGLSRR